MIRDGTMSEWRAWAPCGLGHGCQGNGWSAAPDYWLKRDQIEHAEAEQVRITFEAAELEEHRIQYGE